MNSNISEIENLISKLDLFSEKWLNKDVMKYVNEYYIDISFSLNNNIKEYKFNFCYFMDNLYNKTPNFLTDPLHLLNYGTWNGLNINIQIINNINEVIINTDNMGSLPDIYSTIIYTN
jgi:hypothetical protein